MLELLTRLTDALDRISAIATNKMWEHILGMFEHPDGDWGHWFASVYYWAVACVVIPVWFGMCLLNVAVCCLVGIGHLAGKLFGWFLAQGD